MIGRPYTATLAVLASCSLFLALVLPSVGKIKLEDLIQKSDAIVVAKVDALIPRSETPPKFEVESDAEELWIAAHGKRAHAVVSEMWKGAGLKEVEYIAESTWTCDISDAAIGEVAVLFLTKSEKNEPRQIMWSGYGRMKTRTVKDSTFADVWTKVVFPKDVELLPGPTDPSSSLKSIQIEALKKLVVTLVEDQAKAKK